MSNMFTSAEAFSQNLDKWDTSNVTTMNRMFQEAKTFNGDISTKQKCNMPYVSKQNLKDISLNVEMFQNEKKKINSQYLSLTQS